MNPVFIYSRVSTEEQRKGWSLDAQREECSKSVQSQNKRTVIFTDVATGSNCRRTGLRDLLTRLAADKPDRVIVWRADRLSRNQSDFWRLVRKIERAGAYLEIYSTQTKSNDPVGRLILGTMIAVAEYELYTLKTRTKAGLDKAKKEGVHCGSPGYGTAIEKGKIKELPIEKENLELIFKLRADGKSLRTIADLFNQEGIPTKKGGKKWYASTIRSIITTAKDLLQIKKMI